MTRYYIREWDKRYEVDNRGHVYQGSREKRAGPLEYVRLKVNGRSLGVGWRKLISCAGVREAPGVFGIFCKCLEVAADAGRDGRGYVDDTEDEPLAFLLGLDGQDVANALRVLSSPPLNWLVREDAPQQDSAKTEIPGQLNSTQLNTTQLNHSNHTNQPSAPDSPGMSGDVRECQETPGNNRNNNNAGDFLNRHYEEHTRKLIDAWNAFAKKKVSAAEEMAVDREYVPLIAGVPPNRFSPDELLGAVENYRDALAMPNSQAKDHTLAGFLQRGIFRKYCPGVFNPDHFDGSLHKKTGAERNIPKELEEYRERKRRFLAGE